MRCRLAACVAAIALAGCGGHDERADETGPPKPTETAQQAVARIGAIARARDCSSLAKVYHPQADARPELCARLLASLVPRAGTDPRVFGTAALMDGAHGEQTALVLDRNGRFQVGVTFGQRRVSQPARVADDTAAKTVDAIRGNDCKALLSVAFAYPASGQEYCDSAPLQALRRLLDRDRTARPVRLGGTRSWAFYGLNLKPRGYYTLVLYANPVGFFFIGAYAAR